jgi:hypothetical protein
MAQKDTEVESVAESSAKIHRQASAQALRKTSFFNNLKLKPANDVRNNCLKLLKNHDIARMYSR